MGAGRLLGAVACLVVATGCTVTVTATEDPPREEKVRAVGGSDIEDPVSLQSTWWTWAASEPEESNPVSDTTGEFCHRGQGLDVWLLAGSFGDTVTRACSVPAGMPLAGPVVNFLTTTEAECAEAMRDAEGTVTLDGAPLPVRDLSPAEITYEAVDGNPVTEEGGEFAGYGCGLWFSLPAPASGEHTLVIDGSSGDFSLSVTYELTVL
jgi:hypothetical protein